jgi:hypothetical protein
MRKVKKTYIVPNRASCLKSIENRTAVSKKKNILKLTFGCTPVQLMPQLHTASCGISNKARVPCQPSVPEEHDAQLRIFIPPWWFGARLIIIT